MKTTDKCDICRKARAERFIYRAGQVEIMPSLRTRVALCNTCKPPLTPTKMKP